MLKKILICILVLCLVIPVGVAFADDSSSDVYCTIRADVEDDNHQKLSINDEFLSFDKYLNYINNILDDGYYIYSIDVTLYQDNSKVVIPDAIRLTVHADGHSFEFVGRDGKKAGYINLGLDDTLNIDVNDGIIGGDYSFDLPYGSSLNLTNTIVDGNNKTYTNSVFSIHEGASFSVNRSTLKNFKFDGKNYLVRFVRDASDFRIGSSFTGSKEAGGSISSFILNCEGDENGCIYMDNGDDSIRNIHFKDCKSDTCGGAICSHGGEIRDCEFTNCDSYYGGAIYAEVQDSSLEIYQCIFDKNYADHIGGAIYTLDYDTSDVSISRCTFKDNEADGDGGAIYCNSTKSFMILSSFENNISGADGGAIYINKEHACVNNDSFISNKSEGDGGAICIDGDQASIMYSSFTTNRSEDDGGAIYVTVGTDMVYIGSCEFNNNSAADENDDIDGRSDTSISGSTISNGNLGLIICIAEALVFVAILLYILKRKQDGNKNEKN